MSTAVSSPGVEERLDELPSFLRGGPQRRPFVRLDPSSFAAVHAGRSGGNPTFDDELAFHRAFPNDAIPPILINYDAIPELRWKRRKLREDVNGDVHWEETLSTPGRAYRRVIVDHAGTTPWLTEAAVRSPDDFALLDFWAECVRDNAAVLAGEMAPHVAAARAAGFLPGAVILSAFEVYWLVDYPDMPLFFTDWPDRYLQSVRKIHTANLALLAACAQQGVEMFYTGSAGCELLSPDIFRRAIVPFQREFNDRCAELGCFSSYHICGHSRQLIEQGIIDAIRPTVFETCSTPPCGNNTSLRAAVRGVSDAIITKGNLSLELLRNGTPAAIAAAVREIGESVRGRRHMIGQADATILTGTPDANIRAFLDAAYALDHSAPARPAGL